MESLDEKPGDWTSVARAVGRALNVLFDEVRGLLVGEDPVPADFGFFGVIPSFSFNAGERIEANDENIFKRKLISSGQFSAQLSLWSSVSKYQSIFF